MYIDQIQTFVLYIWSDTNFCLICYSVHWFFPLHVEVLKKEVTVVEALGLGLEDRKERL